MLEPAGGGGFDFKVSTHMLNGAAGYLHSQAQGVASSRDGFNAACYAADGAFGNGYATKCFNEFFQAWFTKLDAQAETLESTADGTQQAAALYDRAERHIYGAIPAMPTQPPPAPPSQSQNGGGGLFPNLNPQKNVA
jgi:hypothetical protein